MNALIEAVRFEVQDLHMVIYELWKSDDCWLKDAEQDSFRDFLASIRVSGMAEVEMSPHVTMQAVEAVIQTYARLWAVLQEQEPRKE